MINFCHVVRFKEYSNLCINSLSHILSGNFLISFALIFREFFDIILLTKFPKQVGGFYGQSI